MALRSQTQRTFLMGFVVSIAACGLVGIFCLLVGKMNDLAWRVVGTTAATAAASILGLASAVPWERRRWQPVGPLGIGAVALALGLLLFLIWFDSFLHGWIEIVYIQSLVSAIVLGVALPHVGLMSLARLRRQYEWVRYATVAAIALLALQMLTTILNDFDGDVGIIPEELWYRFMGVLGIAGACGTVAVPILHRVSAIRVQDETHTVDLSATVKLVCPRCGKDQQLALGRSQCGSCGLRIRVEIEEEHCRKCGYVLYKLESAVYPECGTPVAESTLSE